MKVHNAHLCAFTLEQHFATQMHFLLEPPASSWFMDFIFSSAIRYMIGYQAPATGFLTLSAQPEASSLPHSSSSFAFRQLHVEIVTL